MRKVKSSLGMGAEEPGAIHETPGPSPKGSSPGGRWGRHAPGLPLLRDRPGRGPVVPGRRDSGCAGLSGHPSPAPRPYAGDPPVARRGPPGPEALGLAGRHPVGALGGPEVPRDPLGRWGEPVPRERGGGRPDRLPRAPARDPPPHGDSLDLRTWWESRARPAGPAELAEMAHRLAGSPPGEGSRPRTGRGSGTDP